MEHQAQFFFFQFPTHYLSLLLCISHISSFKIKSSNFPSSCIYSSPYQYHTLPFYLHLHHSVHYTLRYIVPFSALICSLFHDPEVFSCKTLHLISWKAFLKKQEASFDYLSVKKEEKNHLRIDLISCTFNCFFPLIQALALTSIYIYFDQHNPFLYHQRVHQQGHYLASQ